MERRINQSVVKLIRGDIADLEVDAFVFDARTDLKLGSGYGGAITQRGGPVVQKELDAIGSLKVGQVVVTGAGNMKAEHIIHAVGPKFQEEDEDRKMREAVKNALIAADERGIRRVAFPPMGTGLYAFPLGKCAKLMFDVVKSYLENSSAIEEVVFCVRDTREYEPFEAELSAH